jgi:hypothetical protein
MWVGEDQNSRRDSAIYIAMAAINLAIGYYYIHLLPIQLGGDTAQNIEIADALLGRKGGEFYYYRSWGYPLFLILTGLPWSHKPEPVLIGQLILGSAIPYLVGSTLRRLGVASWISISSAAISLISLSPIILSASILSDQVSQFLLYLVVWLIVLGLARTHDPATPGRLIWQYSSAIAVAFSALALIRPANALLGLITLSVAYIVGGPACRRLMLRAISILLFATVTWLPLQTAWVFWSEFKSHRTFEQVDGSLAGAMFFWNIYSSGSTFVGRPIIKPSNGPCSQSLYESLQREASSILSPPVTADTVMAQPTLLNHYIIWKSLEKDFGTKKMDHVFWCAAFEGIYAEPKSLLYYYDGLLSFFLISDVIYNNGYRQAWPSIDQYANTIPRVPGSWGLYVGTIIKIVASFIALMTYIPIYRRAGDRRVVATLLWTMLLYIAAIHVVFAAPHWRYALVIIPALVSLAALGVDSAMGMSTRGAARLETDE